MTGTVWRVLPDVAAVDRPFDYWAPPDADVPIGTIVRVPLRGRRVRGWLIDVVDTPDAPAGQVLAVRAVVSAGAPPDLVDLAAWAAWRWAGPRSVFLRAASPPNVVPVTGHPESDVAVHPPVDPPIALPAGDRRLVVWPPLRDRGPLVGALLATEGSTIVVAPDRAERPRLADAARATGRRVVELDGTDPAAARTAAWSEARRGAVVVLGGRAAAFAPVPDLRAAVVLDDADDALVDERAPTWHARDLLLERAARAGAVGTIVTPAPTVDALAACPAVAALPPRTPRSGWPVVEVVDRRREPPGLGLLGERLAEALHQARARDRRSVCVLNRRGHAHLLVCRRCGEPARCTRCGTALTLTDDELTCPHGDETRPAVCAACGSAELRIARPGVGRLRDELRALLPRATVSVAERNATPDPDADVVVGTEAALHPEAGGRPIGLVAFLDFDQELLAARFRATEQALWLVVRAGRLLDRRGARILVQTRVPDHPLFQAIGDEDPRSLVHEDAERRRQLQLPPSGGLAAVSGATAALDAAVTALQTRLEVLGPIDGTALVRAETTARLCDGLAATDLAPARALGRLRVDVDPQRV